jgi:hypothetical protein
MYSDLELFALYLTMAVGFGFSILAALGIL